jgi:UDP-N-acetylmuramoylalanine--D-glutamate ligase
MSEFEGKKVLVIGLARAGTGMARALSVAGAVVTAVDQKSADSPSLFGPIDELSGLGVDIVTSWPGTIEDYDVDFIAPSPGVPAKHPALVTALHKGLPILSEIEIAYRLTDAPVVAITGTNGKSTVTALTHHLLVSSGKRSVLCGNIAGSGFEEKTITSAASQSNANDILVAEVSSFQLEWIDRFRPRAATITNITPDHLDRYASFEEYSATKKRIFANMSGSDLVVVNRARPETFPPSDCAAEIAAIGEEAIVESLGVRFGDTFVEMKDLWVPAEHSLFNLAHAVLLVRKFGLAPADVLPYVDSFKGLENRLEFIGEKDGIRIVNNSMCTNPSAVLSSLDGVSGRVLLMAGGVSKVDDLSPLAEVGSRVGHAFLFGRDGRKLEAAFSSGDASTSVFNSLDDAFAEAVRAARSGDTILLSPGCASFDQFDDFIDRGNHFRRLAREWIGS